MFCSFPYSLALFPGRTISTLVFMEGQKSILDGYDFSPLPSFARALFWSIAFLLSTGLQRRPILGLACIWSSLIWMKGELCCSQTLLALGDVTSLFIIPFRAISGSVGQASTIIRPQGFYSIDWTKVCAVVLRQMYVLSS